jgi:protein gp37
MGDKSHIEWTDATWNPVTGCDQVSEGCGLPRPGDATHGTCYALTLAARLKAMGNPRYQRDGDLRTSGPGFGVTLHGDQLDLPLRWRKPRRIFTNSMSDLFHDGVPDEFIARVFAIMAEAPQHTFQVLTKRPGRMASLLSRPEFPKLVDRAVCDLPDQTTARLREDFLPGWPDAWPLPNVWLGTSVESQKWADVRVPKLLETPAAVRFLSCEPLLGPIDLWQWFDPDDPDADCERCGEEWWARFGGHPMHTRDGENEETGEWCPGPLRRHSGINWVIVGGESGPGARPMHPRWPRDLLYQCQAAEIPYFFKQWGAWSEGSSPQRPDAAVARTDGQWYAPAQRLWDETPYVERDRVNRKDWAIVHRTVHKSERELDGRTWDEYPREAAR